MRIPNFPLRRRRFGIQRPTDVFKCGQSVVVVTHLTVDQGLELRQHHIDLSIDHGNENAVEILKVVVIGQAMCRAIPFPILPLFFVLATLLVAFGEIFELVALGGLQTLDPRLQFNDVAVTHGHLRSILSFDPATYRRRLNAGLTVAVNPL